MKVSEPKMPEPSRVYFSFGIDIGGEEYTERHPEYTAAQVEAHHAAWQAYAAGIRAAVLGEVAGVLRAKLEAHNAVGEYSCCADTHTEALSEILAALTTTQQGAADGR